MKVYTRNGVECVLCHTRRKLIKITPEEKVRQNFVLELIEKYQVPPEYIAVEVPLSYYEGGERKHGRADIIVSAYSKEYGELPILIVECKAPSIELTDKVIDQILAYDDFLETEIIVVTNGIETMSFAWDYNLKQHRSIKNIPVYKDLINGTGIKFDTQQPDTWRRPNHLGSCLSNRKALLENHNLGEDTEDDYISLIANLTGLIYDCSNKIEILRLKNKKFKSDEGLRYTTFGNSAGGSFTGDYRYFVVEDKIDNTELVSIAIMGKLSAKNDPVFGNSKGYTLLNLAIDDFEQSHLSLEYAIDRFVKIENNRFYFWHDGTITVGKLGRAKNQDLIDFIALRAPHLLKNGRIYLGELDNAIVLQWNQEAVQNLVANFIDYAFLRDEFRRERKGEKMKNLKNQ